MTDFSSGFFELLIHEVLVVCNYKVEVHPSVNSDRVTRPDFHAVAADGEELVVEATVVTGESDTEKARSNLLSCLFDQISQLNLPDYYLEIRHVRNPSGKQPSGKQLRRFITDCVNALNYETLLAIAECGAIQDLPRWLYKEGSLEIDFGVMPVSRANRGDPRHRPIGIYPGRVTLDMGETAVRSKILKKAGKYGSVHCPFIVAANCLNWLGARQRDELNVLFGKEEPRFRFSDGQLESIGGTKGVWYSGRSARNTRVSGLLCSRVYPWNLPRADFALYLNPWTSHAYRGALQSLPVVSVADCVLKKHAGKSLGNLLGLPDDWPGPLFD